MLDHTNPPASGQAAHAVNEWHDLMTDVANRNLVDGEKAGDINTRHAISLLDANAFLREVRSLLDASPLPGKALDAIAPAFTSGDVIELRAVNPVGGGSVSLCGRLDDPKEREALEGFIRRHNGTLNLYVGINPRRSEMAGTTRAAKAPDVVARRAIVLDLDFKDAPSADPYWALTVAALSAELGSFLSVQSGNGTHLWLDVEAVSGADVSASAMPLAAAMARLGADNMADPARIIRLPFTVNIPTTAKRERGNVLRMALPVSVPAAARHARPVADLCAALEGVAVRLGLPGKGKLSAAAAASRVSADGGAKSGWGAPSAELLRMALDELPNDPGCAFDDRDSWQVLGHAIKGAAMNGGCDAEGRDAWLDWCARNGGDPDHNAEFWDTCNHTYTGWGSVMRTLEAVNPAGHARVKHAVAVHRFAQQAAVNVAAINVAPFAAVQQFDPKAITPRRFLYGGHVIGDYISMVVAPGGMGKSALSMAEAVAMASGKELLAGDKPRRPLKVWLHNGEDGDDEQARRLAAAMKFHGVTHAELGDRLFLTSGRTMKITLARQGKDGPELVPGIIEGLIKRIEANSIDVLILDPLGAFHTLPENSNEAANLLMDGLRQIVHSTGAAIVLIHHTGKIAERDMAGAGAGAARGASAFVQAARVSRQLSRASNAEVKALGIPPDDAWRYIWIDNGKANLTPIFARKWFKLESVQLGNGTLEYPDGDNVQTVSRWEPPTPQPAKASDLHIIQQAISGHPHLARSSESATDWVGYLAAEALGLDAGRGLKTANLTDQQCADRAKVKSLLADGVSRGAFIVVEEADPTDRNKRPFLRVGKPALFLDTQDDDTPAGGYEAA